MNVVGTKLAAALVKAQAEMGGAKKDTANPFFKSKYADLSSVDAAIGAAAAKYGLAYVQVSHNIPDHAAIETVIIHESGEQYPCGVVSVPVAKGDAQGYGSAMTYARRYSLSAAFGVCPEDDDGNAAAKAAPKAKSIAKDAFDSLPAGTQNLVADLATPIKDLLASGNTGGAYDKYEVTKGQLQDEIHQAALWSLFGPAERSAIKAEGVRRSQ